MGSAISRSLASRIGSNTAPISLPEAELNLTVCGNSLRNDVNGFELAAATLTHDLGTLGLRSDLVFVDYAAFLQRSWSELGPYLEVFA